MQLNITTTQFDESQYSTYPGKTPAEALLNFKITSLHCVLWDKTKMAIRSGNTAHVFSPYFDPECSWLDFTSRFYVLRDMDSWNILPAVYLQLLRTCKIKNLGCTVLPSFPIIIFQKSIDKRFLFLQICLHFPKLQVLLCDRPRFNISHKIFSCIFRPSGFNTENSGNRS